ncbi:MAG: hypothetical protein HUU50_22840, partial [Candidatus Brocadiae bacterium]|nr:hypothetical protein [Candidatus Brocadiia bacterium]
VLMMVGYAPDEKEEVSKNEIVEDDNEEDDNEEDNEYKYVDREDLAIFVKILTSVKK